MLRGDSRIQSKHEVEPRADLAMACKNLECIPAMLNNLGRSPLIELKLQ
jgi:hypothetical protein